MADTVEDGVFDAAGLDAETVQSLANVDGLLLDF